MSCRYIGIGSHKKRFGECMVEVIILEWTYAPSGYFEEKVERSHDTYTLVVDNGRAEARIAPSDYDLEHKTRDVLHEILKSMFLGVQPLTHKRYTLSEPSVCHLHSDGRKDVTVFTKPIVVAFSASADFIHKDRDGNVILDSRKDRMYRMSKLADLAAKYRNQDKTSDSLLSSYNMAVEEPDNEFIHLFEIRDALVARFGSKHKAMDMLLINKDDYSKLGELANYEPLRQGRHRGSKAGVLRDATTAERIEARRIANDMILLYFAYLENQHVD